MDFWKFWLLLFAIASMPLVTQLFVADWLTSMQVSGPAKERHLGARALHHTVPLGKSFDNLFWVLQVSDIHISKFHDPARLASFRKFCAKTVFSIAPAAVMVTGDLTDAKDTTLQLGTQWKEEWEAYQDVLRSTDVVRITKWIDMRGNHDAFDVRIQGPEDMFTSYSATKDHGHQLVLHSTSFGNYSFVVIDATPKPGARRPFNFFGFLPQIEMDKLQSVLEQTTGSNHTVAMGHYPLPTIVAKQTSSGISLRALLGEYVTAYVCGHLHTLHEKANALYARHPAGRGFLELELADWKDHRAFRVMVFDHDLMSFLDIRKLPAIVVTNPKDASQLLLQKEPWELIRTSTHIRVLLFGDIELQSTTVWATVDDTAPIECHTNEPPLYTCPWNPQNLSPGLHHLHVGANIKDQFIEYSHDFSVDGTAQVLPWFPSLILLLDSHLLLVVGYWISGMTSILVLWSPTMKHLRNRTVTAPIFALAAHWPTLHKTLALFTVYLVCGGPMFIGLMLASNVGMFNVYGVWIWESGFLIPTLIPSPFGVLMMTFHLATGVIPMAYFLGWLSLKPNKPVAAHTRYLRGITGLITLLLIGQHWAYCKALYESYGIVAAVVSPAGSWFLIAAVPTMVYAIWKENTS